MDPVKLYRKGICLLPRRDVRLTRLGDRNLLLNFRDTFRSAWSQFYEQRIVLDHWKRNPFGMPGPTIEILPFWAAQGETLKEFAMGHCLHGGHCLRFWAWMVEKMPSEFLEALIAHELWHVVQYANGDHSRLTRKQQEFDADIEPAGMGFDVDGMVEWLRQNRLEIRKAVRRQIAGE